MLLSLFLEFQFQSTRPVKDATVLSGCSTQHTSVSIHASREGRDVILLGSSSSTHRFQSTRPVKDATCTTGRVRQMIKVSIHASREGRDFNSSSTPSG